ncbi:unnamed protein product [Closterium sp. NIES-65]|nr:unnamed protein product [Closterium sp. NIES-65]
MDSSGRVLVQPLGMRAAVAPQYSPVQSRGSAAGAASRASPGTGSAAGSGLKGGGGGGVGRPARTVSAIPRMEGLGGSVPGGNTSGAGALKSPTRAGFFQLAQVGEEGERGEGEADNLPMLPPPGLPQVVQCQHCGQLLEIPAVLPPTKKGVHKLRCGKCIGLAAGPRTGLGAGSATGSDGQGRIGRAGSFESLRCNSAGMLSPVGSVRNSSDSESPAGTPPAKVGSKGGDARATSSSSMGRVDSGSALVGGGGGMASTGNKMGSAGGGGAGAVSGDGRLMYSRCVVVNGEPISDGHVAAAEERAGPIQPGNYWYDQVAGFWGQMGGPCLGMIPPGIDLGPALPKNCSGGNTKVYVNARELHRKDLDRLVKRGLPLTDNMAYRVEANGNVFDGLSGEFLVNLGKLAPSLDNRKRGLGMRIPDATK